MARWLLRCGGEVVVVVFAVFLADETGATVVVAGKDLGMPPSTLGGGAGARRRERGATRWSEISALRGRRAGGRGALFQGNADHKRGARNLIKWRQPHKCTLGSKIRQILVAVVCWLLVHKREMKNWFM